MARTNLNLRPADFADARVIALLTTHHAVAFAETASGSAHALDVTGLQSPDISLWTVWDDGVLVGCGALKSLSLDHGEVKSMHTLEGRRGTGVGGTMLGHIVDLARDRGMDRLSLQTSTWAFFAPAVAFYRSHGFSECPPFSTYTEDPNSIFLSLEIKRIVPPQPADGGRP